MISVDTNIEDVVRQLEKMARFEEIASGHLRPAMSDVVGDFAPAWKAVAPFLTGAYRDSIEGKVTKVVGIEAKGVVGTTVGSTGFPYPAVLETAARIRSSPNPYARRVQELARSKIEQAVDRFWRAIERVMNDLEVR